MRPFVITAILTLLAGSMTAQAMTVERRSDLRRRDALLEAWSSIRVDIERTAMTPQDLAAVLAQVTGDKVAFVYVGRGAEKDAIAPFDLSLRRVSVPALMGIVRDQTDLAFVYRDGIVLLMPEAEVTPLVYFKSYDLRAPTMRLRNFPGPRLGLPVPGDERALFPDDDEESNNTPCGMTAEQLEDAIRSHVTPDAWDETAKISQSRGLFFVTHTPEGHAALEKALITMGVISPPVVVRKPVRLRPRRR